ncbi:molybdenum cofactor guanylyltransferase [Enterococcus haemoperoxidus]|nr:molybdenum cofactor guanylyltransferase [Enterococcus haemoperoxidus]
MGIIHKIPNCTAVILCGGKSSRMGFDKSLLRIDGEFVLLKRVKQLKGVFPEVLLVTDKRSKFPASFSQVEIKEDRYSEKGPLGGLVTALETVKTEYLFLLACDIPNVNIALIQKMAESIAAYDVVICSQNDRLEPLFGFYRHSCLAVLQQQLQTNDWRIRKEFNRFLVKVVESSLALNNVNLPKELPLWCQ